MDTKYTTYELSISENLLNVVKDYLYENAR